MEKVEDRWFNNQDVETLCRVGGNGPDHPTQLYAIKKYFESWMTFLDIGCGSATTLEAMIDNRIGTFYYKGVDFIPKYVKWCIKRYPKHLFQVQDARHLDEPDKSWDFVYSRHLVDHINSFEEGLNEHCRVSKRYVVIVLWRPLLGSKEHEIKNIIDQGKIYTDEWTNDYSKTKVIEALKQKEKEGWKVVELTEEVGKEVKGWDTVIVLHRES